MNETTQAQPNIKNLQYYTLKEVAEQMHVSTRSLHRYIQSGKLEAVKFCGKWRVSDMELKRVLNVQ